jgi:hypothetical protein
LLDQLTRARGWLFGDAGIGKEVLEVREFRKCHHASLSDV